MKKLTRRSFLRNAALGAGVLGWSAKSWSAVRGANEDIRMAVVGFNGRGKDHIKAWTSLEGVRLTALCDVDTKVLDEGVSSLAAKSITVEPFQDIRKLLQSDNIDAISIATPNHWHALASVWGMQAGKDVYVEKPVSYDVWEGEQIIAAARRYKKIVQAGTQSRSSYAIKEAVDLVQKGKLGKVLVSRGLCYKPRPSIGKSEGPQIVPATVDYNIWSGPAPLSPPHRRKFHYDWHWFWDYGAGDLGNQGIHEMDVARWFLGENTLSPRVLSIGGRLGYEDDAETPNTLITFHDYEKAPLIMEVRGLPEKTDSTAMDKYKGVNIGVVVECEGGYVRVPSYTEAHVIDKDGQEIQHFKGAANHFENFIKAVRSRNESELNAPIREGHLSTSLCHTANISYRLGRHASPDAIREQIKGDPASLATYERMAGHLAANGVDLDKTPATLGPVLKMNPAREKFIDDRKANHLLQRAPRKPFVIRV
ncbi:MAG TPA: Gfo/Idh/MocA family oxidoreductase [Verrucomicrobiae bacterium]|jgi:predicted dehydrogenase